MERTDSQKSIPSRPPSVMSNPNRTFDLPSRTQSPQPRMDGPMSRPQSGLDNVDRPNAPSPEQLERMRQQNMQRPPSALSRPPSSNQFKMSDTDPTARSTPAPVLTKPPVSLATIITPDRVKFNLPEEIEAIKQQRQQEQMRNQQNSAERPKSLSSFADLQLGGKGRVESKKIKNDK
jgi:hypothetical protein